MSLADLEAHDSGALTRCGERRFCCLLPACADKPVDARHRSLSVNIATGAWLCHRCGGAGVLRGHWAVRRPPPARFRGSRARSALARAFRLPTRPPVGATERRRSNWRRRLRGLVPVVGTPGAAYLQARGIPPEIATAARVGYAERWEHWAKDADHWRLVGVDRRVIFPIRDRDGRLVGISARAIDAEHAGPKVDTRGEAKRGVFATDGGLVADPLIVCEAPIDALSLAACGVPAIALNGTNWPDWLPSVAAFRTALVATDADDAGRAAGVGLAASLSIGTRCLRLAPPVGKDWNESLQALGREPLAEQLKRALAGASHRTRVARQGAGTSRSTHPAGYATPLSPASRGEVARASGIMPNPDGPGSVLTPERLAMCGRHPDRPLAAGDKLYCAECRARIGHPVRAHGHDEGDAIPPAGSS